MILYHCTPRKHVASIRGWGLAPAAARSRMKRTWLVRHHMIHFARHHVARRHGVHVEDVVVLKVDIPYEIVRTWGDWHYFTYAHIHTTEISFG